MMLYLSNNASLEHERCQHRCATDFTINKMIMFPFRKRREGGREKREGEEKIRREGGRERELSGHIVTLNLDHVHITRYINDFIISHKR